MNLTPIASNMTELTLKDGTQILFSYKTPVAVLVHEDTGWHQYKTDRSWSRITSRHISKWNPLGGAYGLKPQEYFDNLANKGL